MTRLPRLTLLFALAAAPALAQTAPAPAPTPPADVGGKQPMSTLPSNTSAETARTQWSPQLPTPDVAENAPPAAFIQAAQAALAAGRLGEAQEATERAESRALTRSVKPSTADDPSHQPLVRQLSEARQLIGSGDRAGARQKLDEALANPEATAKD